MIMKRIFQIILSILLLILLSPLFLIVSIMVAFTGFPVIFKHKRKGYKGRTIYVIKFRSMINDAMKKQRKGVRTEKLITSVGRFIRPLYLDELPQLINVLKGEMNFIGPRPHTLKELNGLRRVSKDAKKLLEVKPGITGLESAIDYLNDKELKRIQKKLGIRNYARNSNKHKLSINLYYIKHKTLCLDVKIVYWTIKSLFEHLFGLIKQ